MSSKNQLRLRALCLVKMNSLLSKSKTLEECVPACSTENLCLSITRTKNIYEEKVLFKVINQTSNLMF